MPELTERVCAGCGGTFLARVQALKHGRGRTCSKACQYLTMRRRVTVICATCAKPFEVKHSDYDYRVRIGEPPTYCSRRCAHDSPTWKANLGESLRNSEALAKSRVMSIPLMASKHRHPDARERNAQRARDQWADPAKRLALLEGIKRRSESLEWQASPQFATGPDHPKYRGRKNEREIAISRYRYKVWRRDVLARDGYRCQRCGDTTRSLHAHHRQSWEHYPDLRYDVANGETLCAPCHREIPHPAPATTSQRRLPIVR